VRFDQIHAVNAETLARSSVPNDATASVAGLLDLDQSARRLALELVGRLGL
jgi:1-deoxy-D-xylulose-5-phosphate reductoisomerase